MVYRLTQDCTTINDRARRMRVSRPHPSACVATADVPLIGERAAARGSSATEDF
jgi:hypothetical protein